MRGFDSMTAHLADAERLSGTQRNLASQRTGNAALRIGPCAKPTMRHSLKPLTMSLSAEHRTMGDNLAAQAVASAATCAPAPSSASARSQPTSPPTGEPGGVRVLRPGRRRPDSDVDVLAVRPPELRYGADDEWIDSLGRWADQATRAIGNPINLVGPLSSAPERAPVGNNDLQIPMGRWRGSVKIR